MKTVDDPQQLLEQAIANAPPQGRPDRTGRTPAVDANFAADLKFDPADWLAGLEEPVRLFVSRRAGKVTGEVLAGRLRMAGAGEIVEAEGEALLRLSTLRTAGEGADALSLSLPLPGPKFTGVYAMASPKLCMGGFLKGVWWQAEVPAACGALVRTFDMDFSDPDGLNRSKARFYQYEKCLYVCWFNADGTIDETKKEKLTPDAAARDEGGDFTTIMLKLPVTNAPVGATEKRTGHLRILMVTGCANSRIVQYAKQERTFRPPPGSPDAPMPANETADWHQDGADPYGGTVKIDGTTLTFMGDVPAVYEAAMAQNAKVRQLPEGATLTMKWSLETFIYCDGVLKTWVKWGMTVVITKGANGAITAGAATIDRPQFKSPDQHSDSDGNKPH